MGKKTAVPDAWEDDWEAQADQASTQDVARPSESPSRPPQPVTRAERAAQHAEANRKMWESAESPQAFHYLEASSNVPVATTSFKPQVKVLSRKPIIAKKGAVAGMSQLSLGDDGEGLADGGAEPQPTPEEIRARQKREREEKQRRYDQARAKIFGESAPSSGASSPGAVTPPRSEGRHTPQGRGGRGRGGGGGNYRGSDTRHFDTGRQFDSGRQQFDAGRQFDARRANNAPPLGRELFDPNSSPKPDSGPRRGPEGDQQGRPAGNRDEQVPIRAPRGPDGSGRGGFGFTDRGGREA